MFFGTIRVTCSHRCAYSGVWYLDLLLNYRFYRFTVPWLTVSPSLPSHPICRAFFLSHIIQGNNQGVSYCNSNCMYSHRYGFLASPKKGWNLLDVFSDNVPCLARSTFINVLILFIKLIVTFNVIYIIGFILTTAMTIEIFTKDTSWNLLDRIAIKCDLSVNQSINQSSKVQNKKNMIEQQFFCGESCCITNSRSCKSVYPLRIYLKRKQNEKENQSALSTIPAVRNLSLRSSLWNVTNCRWQKREIGLVKSSVRWRCTAGLVKIQCPGPAAQHLVIHITNHQSQAR